MDRYFRRADSRFLLLLQVSSGLPPDTFCRSYILEKGEKTTPKNKGWFRFYDRAIESKKLLLLSSDEFRCLVSLWCIASAEGQNGKISHDFFTLSSRTLCKFSMKKVQKMIEKLKKLDLISGENGNFQVCRWMEYQYEYKSKTPDYRTQKEVSVGKCSGSVREAKGKEDTDTDTETEKNKDIIVNFEKVDMTFAILLHSLILENIPTFKTPNLDLWAKEFRLMRRRDGRTPEQIDFMIRWAQASHFWRANILSPSKLRKQFDTLVAQARRKDSESRREILKA